MPVLPFPGGIDRLPNGLLILSAAAACLYLFLIPQPASLRRALIKTLAIALLAGIALANGAPTVLIIALALAGAGDFLLALEGEAMFQAGLSSFLLAQIALVFLFVGHYDNAPMRWTAEPWRFLPALACIGHSAYLGQILWRKLPRELGAQIAGYALVITVMALFALAYAPLTVLSGAALFYLSDTLIAHERFMLEGEIDQHPILSPLIWITYYLAQALITLGVLL
jgi:uncharacterized membrane protein YhhN